MVDTGSHWTVISEVDWRRWRFSFGKLGKPRSFTGIGGGTILGYPMENVIIRAKNIEGDIVSFNMPFIYFLKSSKAKSKTSTFPSILGVDFLIQYKFILYFDSNNKVAYLETA